MAPHSHTDTEGPQGAVPQSLPAHHRPVRFVLSRGHLQLVVGPDSRLALAQQGLGTMQGAMSYWGLEGSRCLSMNGAGCPGSAGLSARILPEFQGKAKKVNALSSLWRKR